MSTSSPSASLHRVRYEAFGGIISCLEPPLLAWVDKDFMRSFGYADSPLWNREPSHLSAPTEVHMAVTGRCSQRCEGCYMDSGSSGPAEPGTGVIKARLDMLRNMGVFHVALGGGEAFLREDFGEIVSYCRAIGLVPNLTTNGQSIGPREVAICRQMGQVNISLDGVGDAYSINGRHGSFEAADRALTQLVEAGVGVGINCVVSRRNFALLGELVEYASRKDVKEIELLKYKPSGRGAAAYPEFALDQDMIRAFYPRVLELAAATSVELKIDCSFVPAMVYHNPPVEDLEKLAVTGCDGGNLLLGAHPDGTFAACSFVHNDEPLDELQQRWDTSPHLAQFRSLVEQAREPCASCSYLAVCRCGCRAVAIYFTGDMLAPDPECPRVHDTQNRT